MTHPHRVPDEMPTSQFLPLNAQHYPGPVQAPYYEQYQQPGYGPTGYSVPPMYYQQQPPTKLLCWGRLSLIAACCFVCLMIILVIAIPYWKESFDRGYQRGLEISRNQHEYRDDVQRVLL